MQADELATPARTVSFSPSYRAWLLALTMAVSAFGFIDRVIVATLGQAIKEDLGLSDFQLGILSGLSFAILYSTMGLPIARLAERRSRINIISVSVALFSAATVLCGMAANFWQLFLLRVGVGIGEAGVQAPAVSLLADHFPKERRGAVMTVMKLGNPLGSVIGALTAGWIGSTYGWRAAIICIAAPGLIVALLFRLTLREPPRGLSDPDMAEARSEPPPLRAVLKVMAARPEFRHMLAGLALITLGMYGSGAFYAPFFMRVHGLSLSQVGVFYAVQSGIAATIGLAAAGFGVDLISRRGAQWYALLPALGVLAGVPFTFAGYGVSEPIIALGLLITGAVLAFFHNVPILVAFQNMVGPRMRATAAFVFFFVTTLVGVGFGPALVGFISDLYANALFAHGNYAVVCAPGKAAPAAAAVQAACTAASTSGIRYALMTSALMSIWSATHFYLAARAIRKSAA